MYQYTTPTINISIPSTCSVSDIDDLLVTIQQGETVITKELNDVTLDADNNQITLTLTQEETGSFAAGIVDIQAHIKIGEVVYATQIMSTNVHYNLHQDEL